jgi:Uma2 family endonuclease
MAVSLPWTSADLEGLPDDGKRYEIIDGDLYVSKQPHFYHQGVCLNAGLVLGNWNNESGAGAVSPAPGIIFSEGDDVAPDLIWISNSRLATVLGPEGHLHGAPELVIEVLSRGPANEKRDRESKLELYSQRGVDEYWIIDWRARSVEVYRRREAQLHLLATLYQTDTLQTPLLPGFSCQVGDFFIGIPSSQ